MIDYQDWLSTDADHNALRARRNEAKAARFYAATKPFRTAIDWFGSFVRERWEAWRCERRWKAGLQQMRGLDDRLLDDIGLTRADLDVLESGRARGTSVQGPIARPTATIACRNTVWPQPSCDFIELEPARLARREQRARDGSRQRRGTRDAA